MMLWAPEGPWFVARAGRRPWTSIGLRRTSAPTGLIVAYNDWEPLPGDV
jgi:hypothetical protein